MSSAELSEYEKRVISNVQEDGYQVVSVFAPEDNTPSFSYSVGFWETVGQPEIIILGLNGSMGRYAIEEGFRQCRNGLTITDGKAIEGLLEGYDETCVARQVHPDHFVRDYFNSAMWYHRWRTGQPLAAAMQLVWSYSGSYPWDEEAPQELHEDQPVLYIGKPH